MRKIFIAIAAALCSATLATAQFHTLGMRMYAQTDFNFKRASILSSDGNDSEAVKELQKSVSNVPWAPEPYYALGVIYHSYPDMRQLSIDCLSKAIQLSEKSNPSLCVDALFWRSLAYDDPELRHADAVRAYEMAKSLKPADENKDVGCLALAAYYSTDDSQAAVFFREAVSLAPFKNANRDYLASALISIGTDEALAEAWQVVHEGLALDDEDEDLLNRKAALAIKANDFSTAAQIVVSRFADEGILSADKELWANMRDILRKDPTPVIMRLKGKAAANPMVSTWPELLGFAYESMETPDHALAADYFGRAYELSDNLTDLHFVAASKVSAGDLTGALEALDKYIALDTTSAQAYANRAGINAQLDRKETVLADYAKAISLSDKASLYYQRAWFERYNGMLEEAALDMTTAIQKDDDDAHYYLTRGNILAALGEKEMAREDYESARDAAKAHIDFDYGEYLDSAYVAHEHQTLAFALFYLGDEKGAIGEMEKGMTTPAANATGALYNKVCLLSLMGKKQEALAALGKAVDDGYDEYVHLGRDNDLDNIRGSKEFESLVAKAKANAMGKNSAATAAKPVDNGAPDVVEVPFTKEGGVLMVPCTVNGLPLKYIFDSGANSVTISLVEARFMLRNGYLKVADLGDRSLGSGADGGVIAGTMVVLRSINFGGVTLKNVRATVIETQSAPLLLGQTAMSRYGTATIDYDNGVIRLARDVK